MSFLRRWPFLVLGLMTLGMFVLVERAHQPPGILIAVLRVLIAPLWLMRTVEMLLGVGAWPKTLQLSIALPLLLLPYVTADLLLRWHRRRREGHPAAASPPAGPLSGSRSPEPY
jgi:hypothetical protein